MKTIDKAAVLLLSLDKALAAEVLSQMGKDTVEQVSMRIAQMRDVSKEQQVAVMDEFYNEAREQTVIEQGGVELAGELLEQSLGIDKAKEIMDNLRQSMSSIPFGFLHKAGTDNLLMFVVEEQPQTIALILSHLPPSLSAEVLAKLPPAKQTEVSMRIATMEQTSPEVIQDVENSLRSRMRSSFNQQTEKTGGVPLVAQILNVTDRMTNRGILENLDQENAKLADEIRRLMFVFDDIMKLDDKAIQSLLKEVSNSQWALALKGASAEIKEKILGNLSQRAAEMLTEEIEFLGPVKLSEVEGMQQQIVDAVRKLEDAGEIEVNSGEADQYIN
ncbi:Flagellar motor switch protein FliG [hydrothermal vent metagenome]|uniref:Flagellar motor switch protein FliG n=1 Tax=hydrothermal vent metagenome TaxID=652676 RepID=A0A3B1DUW1_9ZZZZ